MKQGHVKCLAAEYVRRDLVELCSLIVDCPHSTPEWTDTGVVVLRSRNIRGGRLDLDAQPSFTTAAGFLARTQRAVPHGGDLVITREAPMGEVCEVPHGLKCCLGQRMVLLRPDSRQVVGRYLLFALQSPILQRQILMHEGTGSTVSNLRIPSLEALKVPCPSLDEQGRIAAVLGALEDKIELNREMTRTLESMAQAIFKSWFVDFDGHAAEDFVESELGPIPAGWRCSTLGEHVTLQRGTTYESRLLGLPGPVLLGLASIERDGGFRRDKLRTYGGTSPAKLVLKPGDVYVSLKDVTQSGDLLGSAATLPPDIPVGRLTQDTVKLQPTDAGVPNCYLYRFLKTEGYRAFCRARAIGTTNLSLSRDDFLGVPMVVPPGSVMASYSEVELAIQARRDCCEIESIGLAALRDTLLPKLISGEIRVPEAEEAIEDAA